MPDSKTAPEWESDTLKKAAVEYVIQTLGEYPRSEAARASYAERLGTVARQLGAPSVKVLLEWVQNRKLQPPWENRKSLQTRQRTDRDGLAEFATGDVQRYDDTLSSLAATAVHVPAGALPDAMRDPLEAMLAEEDGVLSQEEREEMARALETGVRLCKAERLALACLLRGSELAGRRETVRAVIDWIVPPDGEITEIWEARETIISAPLGSRFRYEPMRHVLMGYGEAGRCRLVIESCLRGALSTVTVRPYCRVKNHETTRKSEQFGVRYLAPVKRFARDHVLYQFALLASLVRQEDRDGEEWGRLFGVKSGKSLVSYHRKKLVDRIQQDTASKVGFRGVRHKPDPRKGTTIKGKEGAA